MPTNLPPEYFEVDKRYRAAETVQEKIILLEELLGTIPKHKGTEHLRGDYKTRLAKLKSSTQSHKNISRHASAFHIEREGAGQVVVIGSANAGKSSLVQALTNAQPEVSPVPFSTWEPLPGMMEARSVQVQLIDTPALDRDYLEPELFNLLRITDVIALLVDLQADPFEQFDRALRILEEHHIRPKHQQSPEDSDPRTVFKPLLVLANKCDDSERDLDCEVFRELLEGSWTILPISTLKGRNLEAFQDAVLSQLDVIRVYAKPPGEEADLNQPFVLKFGSTIEDLAGKVHRDFQQNLKFARVWGEMVHDGQMVGRDYVLCDGDVIELRI
jgi:ribosome-interacting GTPase 1